MLSLSKHEDGTVRVYALSLSKHEDGAVRVYALTPTLSRMLAGEGAYRARVVQQRLK
ncbi:MAG: hypothetical protein BroJett029_34590 [Alphaproteobacteria bacterium]|nr:MAG: hypothetical protein BroJett029_34590 [Alphaproteobacteria bacterium]